MRYAVKYMDMNIPPRADAGRFNPWDQFFHIKEFEASNDTEAEQIARRLIEGSKGPSARVWCGDEMVKELKPRERSKEIATESTISEVGPSIKAQATLSRTCPDPP